MEDRVEIWNKGKKLVNGWDVKIERKKWEDLFS
jgi:hypothetical protein